MTGASIGISLSGAVVAGSLSGPNGVASSDFSSRVYLAACTFACPGLVAAVLLPAVKTEDASFKGR
jgi:hypothetical protein